MSTNTAPNDDPNRRFKRRRVDDDPDQKGRRSKYDDDEDDDDDDKPRRSKKRKKPTSGVSPLVFIGLFLGLIMVCGCFGGGVYMVFISDLSFGNEITITDGTRTRNAAFGGFGPRPGMGFNTGGNDSISIKFKMSSRVNPNMQYTAVARCAGKTTRAPIGFVGIPTADSNMSWSTSDFQGLNGPIEVWIEDVNRKQVSNTYTIR